MKYILLAVFFTYACSGTAAEIVCSIDGYSQTRSFIIDSNQKQYVVFTGEQPYEVTDTNAYDVEQPNTYIFEAYYNETEKEKIFILLFNSESLSINSAWVYGFTGQSHCSMDGAAAGYLLKLIDPN